MLTDGTQTYLYDRGLVDRRQTPVCLITPSGRLAQTAGLLKRKATQTRREGMRNGTIS